MDFLGLFDPSTDTESNALCSSPVTPPPAAHPLSLCSPQLDSSCNQWLPYSVGTSFLPRSPSLLQQASESEGGSKQGGCQLPPEPQLGNVEYKLKLLSPSKQRFEHLVTQMKWRLREGQGEAIYALGVEDSGLMTGLSVADMHSSLCTLQRMADALEASLTLLRQRCVSTPQSSPESSSPSSSTSTTVDDSGCKEDSGDGVTADDQQQQQRRMVAEILVRKIPDDSHSIDLRVAVLGNADAGKSTLLGVLTHGQLDNGRGRSRLNMLRHLHEIQSGRTSSISHEILGFDAEGNTVDYSTCSTTEGICERSSKLLTFIDLAGHHKYLKTTMQGLTGYSPHHVMLVVSANGGIAGTTREHLGLALALQVPLFVIVTKIDLVSRVRLRHTLTALETMLKGPGCACVPLRVRDVDDVLSVANRCSDNVDGLAQGPVSGPAAVVPVFCVSSVVGSGLRLLKQYLYVLSPQMSAVERIRLEQELCEFQIDETFRISESVVVVGGLLTRGVITESMTLSLGPLDDGSFVPVCVGSIQRCRRACRVVRAGQAAALAILPHVPELRRGMVLLSTQSVAHCCWRFQATVSALFLTTKIHPRCPTTIHLGSVRQTAVVETVLPSSTSVSSQSSSSSSATGVDDGIGGDDGVREQRQSEMAVTSLDLTSGDDEVVDTSDTQTSNTSSKTQRAASIVFCFVRHPEYVCVGQRLLFRQGGARGGYGIGTVTRVFPHVPDSPVPQSVRSEE